MLIGSPYCKVCNLESGMSDLKFITKSSSYGSLSFLPATSEGLRNSMRFFKSNYYIVAKDVIGNNVHTFCITAF